MVALDNAYLKYTTLKHKNNPFQKLAQLSNFCGNFDILNNGEMFGFPKY